MRPANSSCPDTASTTWSRRKIPKSGGRPSWFVRLELTRRATMNFNARMSGALVALSLLWQGCLVIPVKETKAAEGQKPPPAGFDHWRVGETSREEVLKELGSPYLQFDDLRVVAYSWRMIVGYMPWFFAAGSQGAGGIEKLTRGYVLLVAFDERDRLAAREVLHHEGWTTIRKTSEAWLHKRGLAHSPVADSPGTHSIHPGQC